MAADDQDLGLIVQLRAAIANSELSYSELARRANVAQSQISRFMSGKTITVITAARLFKYFGLRVATGDGGSEQSSPLDQPAEPDDSAPRPRPLGKSK